MIYYCPYCQKPRDDTDVAITCEECGTHVERPEFTSERPTKSGFYWDWALDFPLAENNPSPVQVDSNSDIYVLGGSEIFTWDEIFERVPGEHLFAPVAPHPALKEEVR